MNWKEHLANIYTKIVNNKKIVSCFLVCFVCMSVLLVALLNQNNNANSVEQPEISEENSSIDNDDEETTKHYQELCAEINEVIVNYNETVKKYNDFISGMNGYGIFDLKEPIDEKVAYEENEKQYSEGSEKVLEDLKESIFIENEKLQEKIKELHNSLSDEIVNDYNCAAKSYNEQVLLTSIDFIEGLRTSYEYIDKSVFEKVTTDEQFFSKVDAIYEKVQSVLMDYQVITQITNPDEKWVFDRLSDVEAIRFWKAVSEENDPNGLLGAPGGYTSCHYFNVKSIELDSVKGKDIVAKGTDAGGAIEVYATLEDAQNRCDYLSQFDNTLLYSGSYVILGTMVIRTSYKLSNEEQIELTNEIVNRFTSIK